MAFIGVKGLFLYYKLNTMKERKRTIRTYEERRSMCIKAIEIVEEDNISLLDAMKQVSGLSSKIFYNTLKEDDLINVGNEEQLLRTMYVRAKDSRSDYLFDEIIKISNGEHNMVDVIDEETGEKTTIRVDDKDKVARDRLMIDARKWALGKMNSNKYGDKIDVTTDGQSINIISLGNGVKPPSEDEE